METYTTLRNTYGVDTKNTSDANLTYGDDRMNEFHRRLLGKADWPFLHRLRTTDTEADTEFVAMPYDVDQVESVFVTVDSTRHNPKPAPSREFWDELHYSTVKSDIPEYWYVYDGQIGLWPTPVTAGNVISINAKVRVIDLSIADYTTGTVSAVTNGAKTITGSGTTWTSQMVGRWIRITNTDATNTGDGLWYEITGVSSTTSLTIERPYGGTTITAGSASYTIGQTYLLPESYQELPEFYGAYRYWSKEKDNRANDFKNMLDDGVKDLFRTYSVNDLSMVVDQGYGEEFIINPNLTIRL